MQPVLPFAEILKFLVLATLGVNAPPETASPVPAGQASVAAQEVAAFFPGERAGDLRHVSTEVVEDDQQLIVWATYAQDEDTLRLVMARLPERMTDDLPSAWRDSEWLAEREASQQVVQYREYTATEHEERGYLVVAMPLTERAILVAVAPPSIDSVYRVLDHLNWDKLQALQTWQGVEAQEDEAVGDEGPEGPHTCTSGSCFEAGFASCAPGWTFAPQGALEARVRYEILGPEGEGCRLSVTYESNPSPEWVGKPLVLTLDPGAPLLRQIEEGMRACLGGAEDRFDCAGPLVEVVRR